MTKMVFDERFGDMTFAQRAAYRKHNVSKSDHDSLVSVYGETNHGAITAAVKEFSTNNSFSEYRMMKTVRGW